MPAILLPAEVLSAIQTHAETTYPEECCGALLGRGGAVRALPGTAAALAARVDPATCTRRELLRAVPLANEWDGRRRERYLIPGTVVRALEAEARGDGLELVGFYHSHPEGAAVPSAFDREVAWPWYSYLIVQVGAGAAGAVRSWRLRDQRGGFVEEEIEVPGSGEEEICR